MFAVLQTETTTNHDYSNPPLTIRATMIRLRNMGITLLHKDTITWVKSQVHECFHTALNDEWINTLLPLLSDRLSRSPAHLLSNHISS
jgi:hypothetical protein